MEFQIYIDGVDAYDYYRLSVAEGGYNDFACFPQLKDVPYNDWDEKNGIDPDLTAPVLDAKSVTIDCYIIGHISRYFDLMAALSDGAYHLFTFHEIGLQDKKLRFIKSSQPKSVQNLHKFSMTFSDDDPLGGYVYDYATSALPPYYDYSIDGKDVSDYGVRILAGTYEEIIKMPDVKEKLRRNLKILSGQYYDDGGEVTYKTRTVGLKCLMRSRSLAEFWQNRNALLYDLTRPGSHILNVASIDKEIPFYYKSCDVESFHPDGGKVWFEFTLNVEFYKGVI